EIAAEDLRAKYDAAWDRAERALKSTRFWPNKQADDTIKRSLAETEKIFQEFQKLKYQPTKGADCCNFANHFRVFMRAIMDIKNNLGFSRKLTARAKVLFESNPDNL